MQKLGLALLVVLPVCPLAFSQTAAATAQSSTTTTSGQRSPQTSIQTVTLGNSAVVLTGPWKFQPGDSPVVDGAPLWAQPAFDDAHWAPMDLTSQDGAVDLLVGTPGYVPGWTSKGYPDLSGYAWYRLSLRVKDATQPLWLKIPSGFDDAFQLYANGRLIGHFGDFTANHVTGFDAEPVSFPLPAPGPDGQIDLAIRFYLTASSQFNNPDVGGLHGAPVLGLASTVQLLQASDMDANLHSQFGGFLATFLYMLVIPLALGAWLYNRQERVWMWFFFALAWTALLSVTVLLSNLTTLLSLPTGILIVLVELPLWIMFWWYWFGLSELRWIPRVAWLLAAAITLLEFCADSPYFGLNFIPPTALHWFNAAAVWVGVPYQLLLLLILIEGFRRDRTEALLAAFPILLGMYGFFAIHLLTAFHVRGAFFPFGLGIAVRTIINILLVVTIGALALRRFLRTRVRDSLVRESERKDLEQAQQLQQRVLVPDRIHSSAFSIESEYRPALTVGGDFYQTISKPDGTLVLVIGDVSGKGISAAMLVAVLVGAIRSQVEHTSDPALMLATLNRRMMGRSGGHFATCLVAEISPSGIMRTANAGHISPYRNGEEIELEGSLPLGITDNVDYPTQIITLHPGDHLTFITDGVVEATNAAKELYGFDRTRDISNQPAAAIMDHVLTFGQKDDITVLGIQFATA
jgi:hypothetical protein